MSNGNDAVRPANERFARLLELQYEGYFMCRLATDPDPTNEERGVSGYTLALAGEPPLDQVIRLQEDDVSRRLRPPADRMGIRITVTVRNVLYDGKPFPEAQALLEGAQVRLDGKTPPFDGPIYDSRNNIVGSDDNMMFVVNPFEMVIEKPGVHIRCTDHLNPADPSQPIWKIEDPSIYTRRFPTFNGSSSAVMSAMRVFDQFTYFNDRLRFLRTEKERYERELGGSTNPERRAWLELEIQKLHTRIYTIEFWGDRFFSKMAYQLTYNFRVNGEQTFQVDGLKGTADTSHPWLANFWFGGWDGDLLVGYMQGILGIPFRPGR
jgi:hypothetical protein